MATSSRRLRVFETQQRLRILKTSLLMGLLLLFIAFSGPVLLVKLSLLMDKLKGGKEIKETHRQLILLAPKLDPLPEVTKEKKISLSGTISSGNEIDIFVNEVKKGQTIPLADGTFTFEDLQLVNGNNRISAVARSENDEESPPSDPLIVFFKNEPPLLEIMEPQEASHYNGERKIHIRGKTDPDANIRINDRVAIVARDGTFDFTIDLSDGENKIKIISRDDAGNESIVDRTVVLNQ